MRYFLIALFFAAQLLSACAAKAEVVGTFTPLKDNERFAYGTEGVHNAAAGSGNAFHQSKTHVPAARQLLLRPFNSPQFKN